jgi:hypothetical protein
MIMSISENLTELTKIKDGIKDLSINSVVLVRMISLNTV